MGMKHRIHHGLEVGLAKKAIGKAMEAYSARFAEYQPSFHWETDTRGRLSFRAKAMSVEGDIEILGDEVTVDLEVPFILKIFRNKAVQIIDREVTAWCEKARNGELD